MKIFGSIATSADGYLDDNTPQRLMISSPEDWAEVHQLRATHDAIMVGANTIRRDNPALMIRNTDLRTQRTARGQAADITKVTVTASGSLDRSARFFTEGESATKIVFTLPNRANHLKDVATVVELDELSPITITTQLEKMGVNSLFLEGGAMLLNQFLESKLIDTLRVAVNPTIIVDDPTAPNFAISDHIATSPSSRTKLGNTIVTTYELIENRDSEDFEMLSLAIEKSRLSPPSPSSYCVGAVILTCDGSIFTGYTHETSPTHHAEQEAIIKAKANGTSLKGATIYSSMEPCSTRKSEPKSCSELIIENGFSDVVFAFYEPATFVNCKGAELLRKNGVRVRVVSELADKVRQINNHNIK